MAKILVTDPIHPSALHMLSESGFEVTELPEEKKQDLAQEVAPYQVIICRTSTTIDTEVLNAAKNLKCIALASTGYDRIDIQEAAQKGVAVLGLPASNKEIDPEQDGNFVSTAEHTVLLMLGALGNVYQATHSLKENKWEKKYLIGNELAHKTVGFFGFGRIAGLVADRLQAFKVNLIAHDPYADKKHAELRHTTLVSFDELCKSSDIISVHAPKTDETVNKFDATAFGMMKDGVFIINTARSVIIDDTAMINALKSGKVCRAAFDVFHDEPHGINHELIGLPNVIATPHIGGSTHEAWARISQNAAKNIIGFFEGKKTNQINV